MLHLPNSMRSKSGNYRFSIPGNPSMYLANSSYGCWIEMGCPAEIDFNVSPILLEGNQRIFNLARSIRDFRCLNEFEEDPLKIWESDIFGKSLNELVNEGLRNKLCHMPADARGKIQETLEKIINEGCSGLICIIL